MPVCQIKCGSITNRRIVKTGGAEWRGVAPLQDNRILTQHYNTLFEEEEEEEEEEEGEAVAAEELEEDEE